MRNSKIGSVTVKDEILTQANARTPNALKRVASAAVVGLMRSSVYAAYALIIPLAIALLPTLAAFHLLGSPWSWSNLWSWVGLAFIAVPVTLALAHPVSGLFRRLIRRWAGMRIGAGFKSQPDPVKLTTGHWWNGASYARSYRDAKMDLRVRRIREPAYWREVRWVVIAAIVVAPVCLAPAVAIIAAIFEFSEATTSSIALGTVLLLLGIASSPWGWRTVAPLALRWLVPAAPVPSAADLRSQRADLSAAHDSEIRRIERDLHDGAQARLVAVGLDLSAVEQLIRTDPEKAETILRSAKEGTRASLNDLRDLVHGVYPSVLIERGLVPAIRAVALDSPLDVDVNAPADLKVPSPVAAALYFAVSEMLANIVKHTQVSEASVTVQTEPQSVEIMVRDKGPGGACVQTGGGLDGVRRRLEAFDATLNIHSPAGGPTEMTVHIPCE